MANRYIRSFCFAQYHAKFPLGVEQASDRQDEDHKLDKCADDHGSSPSKNSKCFPMQKQQADAWYLSFE